MPAEALEARLVREPFLHQMNELLDRLVAGIADRETAVLAALPAVDVDSHRGRGGALTSRRSRAS
jgi:hypothetical protein